MKVQVKFISNRNASQQTLLVKLLFSELVEVESHSSSAYIGDPECKVAFSGNAINGREEYVLRALNMLESYSDVCEYHVDGNFHSYKGGRIKE